MKRRRFLKNLVAGPLIIKNLAASTEIFPRGHISATPKNFEFLEVSGSYEQIGFQIGRHFGKNIRGIIEKRKKWHSRLLSLLATPENRLYADELLRLSKTHFPHIVQEITGMANGAGIDFNSLWAMCIKSELQAREETPPGCSTIVYRNHKNLWLLHNEDGHLAYRDLMFLVKVKPPSGVDFMALVYPGIITGNGPALNNRGVIQTTNYISSTKSEPGIPRYIIGRAILEAKNLNEAVELATIEKRSYPYHHNLASFDDRRYLTLETVPGTTHLFEPTALYFHTNHLLHEKTGKYQFQDPKYVARSSMSRYKVIGEKLKQLDLQQVKPHHLLEILAAHQNAPYSPCRHPAGEVSGLTLGTAFFDIEKGIFRLYRGNPCQAVPQNNFVDLGF